MRSAGDAGFTLPEVLVTVSIIGVAFATLLGGMAVAVRASSQNRQQADAQVAAQALAEAVKTAPYTDCATTYSPAFAKPDGVTASVTLVRYWDGTADTGSFSGTCPAADKGVQLVTVLAKSTDERASATVTVGKRRP